MFTNWKTNGAGIAAILAAVSDIIHSLVAGTPVNWNADVPAILAGIGLLTAKDATTHSTVEQTQAATAVVTGVPDAAAQVKAADAQVANAKKP